MTNREKFVEAYKEYIAREVEYYLQKVDDEKFVKNALKNSKDWCYHFSHYAKGHGYRQLWDDWNKDRKEPYSEKEVADIITWLNSEAREDIGAWECDDDDDDDE